MRNIIPLRIYMLLCVKKKKKTSIQKKVRIVYGSILLMRLFLGRYTNVEKIYRVKAEI